MKLTIAYFTNRRDPKWKWFVESLRNQTTEVEANEIDLVFIDAQLWTNPERAKQLDAETNVRTHFPHVQHLPPKPNVWQGPHRQTKRDWFAASNARNTALIVARGGYFVGVDDLSVLIPGWMDQVRHAMENRYCVCGAYRKDKDMIVERGTLLYSNPHSIDSRWEQGLASGITPAAGSWLFGCSFGMTLAHALYVNGFDEICDGQSAEDYDFGIRVGRLPTARFFYNRNMLTIESEEGHHLDAALPRASKLVTNLPPGYTKNPMSDHVLLNRLLDEDNRIHPLATPELMKLRWQYLEDKTFPLPEPGARDWRDGMLLSDLV